MPTVRTNDVDTYYERSGEGPPVVFVHGAIVDHGQWDPQVERLAGEYTVVTYDLRGHGRTGPSDRSAYSIELFAEDLAALVDALGLERPVVVGHSMGGCVALAYAVAHPDGLSGLVLADSFGPRPLDWRERLQRSSLRATIPLVRLFGYERVERWQVWLQERLQGEGVSGDYERVEALRATGPLMTSEEFAKVIRALVAFARSGLDPAAVAVPTLVLHGENDAGFVRRQAAHLGATIPDATVQSVPDAGHAANLDNPDAFTTDLGAFLARVTPGEDDGAA
ncbi:MAG: alpha/beta fold hydrolase [Haloarculaceae archaeon]